MCNPKITVLMCTNRADDFLQAAIASVLSQTFAEFELVLIANGVTDFEYDLIQRGCTDSRVRLARTGVRGLTFSLNFGLHLASCEIVARMDADDIAYPGRLGAQFAFMQAHPEVTVCGSGFELIDPKGTPHQRITPIVDNHQIRRALRYSNPICHPTIIFRRSDILSVGGYTGNGCAEDFELWLRLAEDPGKQFYNLPDCLLGYRLSSSGVARRSRRAYVHCAAAQYRSFLLNGDPGWLIGTALNTFKAFAKGRRERR